MGKVVIGMIGTGFAGRFHVHNYLRTYNAEVVFKAVAGSNLAKTESFAKEFGFKTWVDNYQKLLEDPEINVIDIVTPPHLHAPMIIDALNAGKHVITEKPLTGYFKEKTDGKAMYEAVEAEIAKIEVAEKNSGKYVMYAENWVYAPGVQKSVELLNRQKGKLLYMHAEESHSGSHAHHAANWKYNGGGALIRQGCHPVSALLYLKSAEAAVRGEQIGLKSVTCDVGFVTACLSDAEKTHIDARPVDVEDIADLLITFTDNTKAHIVSADMLLGGMKNCIDLYLNNAVHRFKMNPNDTFMAYHPEANVLDDVFFTEKLGVKSGWQYLAVSDDVVRGYVDEFQDFVECVALNRKPVSGLKLAGDTLRVIYAGYRSALEGRRIDF